MNETARTLLDGALTGAKAGMAASVPMGATMQLGRLVSEIPDRGVFSTVTHALDSRIGVDVDKDTHERLAWAGHVGYGAGFGALFGVATAALPQRARSTAVTTGLGALFGVAVWALSATGWLPKARVLPAARQSKKAFNAINLGSHVVWGTTMGAMVGRGASEKQTILGELANGRHR